MLGSFFSLKGNVTQFAIMGDIRIALLVKSSAWEERSTILYRSQSIFGQRWWFSTFVQSIVIVAGFQSCSNNSVHRGGQTYRFKFYFHSAENIGKALGM